MVLFKLFLCLLLKTCYIQVKQGGVMMMIVLWLYKTVFLTVSQEMHTEAVRGKSHDVC